jgi:ribosomal protein S18 acetylase RimI-like enzyme
MKTRTATIRDIPAIKRLFWELDTDAIAHQPEHFVRTERPDDYLVGVIENPKADFLLAVVGGNDGEDRKDGEDGEVIGFSLIFEKGTGDISCLKKCRYGYIQDFVVAAEHRNRGYGTALLDASKGWAGERGLEYLRLSVFPTNEGGIRFYSRHGLGLNMITMECKL